jgi:hypothetical protein
MYQGFPARKRTSQAKLNKAQPSYTSIGSAPRTGNHQAKKKVNDVQEAIPVHPEETSTPSNTKRETKHITLSLKLFIYRLLILTRQWK